MSLSEAKRTRPTRIQTAACDPTRHFAARLRCSAVWTAFGYPDARSGSGRDARFIARPPHRTVRAAFPHTAPTLGV